MRPPGLQRGGQCLEATVILPWPFLAVGRGVWADRARGL